MRADYLDTKEQSSYQPSQEVMDFTDEVKKTYNVGYDILHSQAPELNNLSVIDRMNRDQRTFNAFVDESVEDPDDEWEWKGTRSTARKKAMALHAHLTMSYIVPNIVAQNEDDEEDQEFSDIMHDIVEWMIINSEYLPSFILATQGMLVNPVTYLGAEYCQVFQTIKEKDETGNYTKKEILDEVFSGFQAPVYSAEQVLISNKYEQNIQKHRAIIKRRYIDYGEAEAKWGEHENWPHVEAGVNVVYNEEDGLFYKSKDLDHPFQVEECTYLNRRDDTEVCFVGGIYMGKDDVEANPIKHRDNKNTPKYNVTPFGYHRINEHYYFYKSLMNEEYWEDVLIDAMYANEMNRQLLDINTPLAVTGADEIDGEIIFPKSVAAFADKDTKVTNLLPPRNSNSFQALQYINDSMSENSVSEVDQGQVDNATAYSIARAQTNSKILRSAVTKSLGVSVAAYGQLMSDIAVNHITVPQVEELADGGNKLKYKQFILNNKTVGGKKVSKRIVFDDNLIGSDMSEEEKKYANAELLTETGYPDHTEVLLKVNPELFARMKYLSKNVPEMMDVENEDFQKALMIDFYEKTINDPYLEHEAMLRKLAHAYFRSDVDELIAKQAPTLPNAPANGVGGAPVGLRTIPSPINKLSATAP